MRVRSNDVLILYFKNEAWIPHVNVIYIPEQVQYNICDYFQGPANLVDYSINSGLTSQPV